MRRARGMGDDLAFVAEKETLCDPSTSDHAGRVGAVQLCSWDHSHLHSHRRALRTALPLFAGQARPGPRPSPTQPFSTPIEQRSRTKRLPSSRCIRTAQPGQCRIQRSQAGGSGYSTKTLREERASITLAMVQTGIATGKGETFTFSIKPLPTGFRLDNCYSGGCHVNTIGAGIWPTVGKAREIAEATARHLLSGAVVTWDAE